MDLWPSVIPAKSTFLQVLRYEVFGFKEFLGPVGGAGV